eukprot:267920-Alexandrium_andersonii.AAC.1
MKASAECIFAFMAEYRQKGSVLLQRAPAALHFTVCDTFRARDGFEEVQASLQRLRDRLSADAEEKAKRDE